MLLIAIIPVYSYERKGDMSTINIFEKGNDFSVPEKKLLLISIMYIQNIPAPYNGNEYSTQPCTCSKFDM